MTAIRENGATSGVGVLGVYGYDDLGQRISLTRGNGTVTSYGRDPISRLTSLGHDFAGTVHDVTTSFTYNAASQIASSTRNNDAYAWLGHYNVDRSYGVNALNQLTSAGAVNLGYDGRGNLTSSGADSFAYGQRNQLYAKGAFSLSYDPAGRLDRTQDGSAVTTYAYDGSNLIAEYDLASGAMTSRYVHGPGTDDPLVWYDGAGTGNRRWLYPDERGSIVALANAAGTVTGINTYDEYGIPGAGNVGRFQYTGQTWLPGLGLYYYKARMYSPTLGRFMQRDPSGYGDGMNMYAYVGGDPVNRVDPSGNERVMMENQDSWGSMARLGSEWEYDSGFIDPTGGGRDYTFGWVNDAGGRYWQSQVDKKNSSDKKSQSSHSVSSTLAVAAGALVADDVTGLGVADDPVAAVLGIAAVGALAVETVLKVHANSYQSQKSTEVYNLINMSSGMIDKIGINSNASARYSGAWLVANNVRYSIVERYSSRYPAIVHENIALTWYKMTYGSYPRLNRIAR